MIPFLQGERERLQRADKALSLIERKLGILRSIGNTKPLLSFKLQGQIEKNYEEYEQAKAEILKRWDSEGDSVRDDVVVRAENFKQY